MKRMTNEIQKELSDYFDIRLFMLDEKMSILLKTFKVQSA